MVNKMTKKNDSEIISRKHTHCNGGSEESGHPKVYLEIKPENNKIVCPYCSKLFIYNEVIKTNWY